MWLVRHRVRDRARRAVESEETLINHCQLCCCFAKRGQWYACMNVERIFRSCQKVYLFVSTRHWWKRPACGSCWVVSNEELVPSLVRLICSSSEVTSNKELPQRLWGWSKTSTWQRTSHVASMLCSFYTTSTSPARCLFKDEENSLWNGSLADVHVYHLSWEVSWHDCQPWHDLSALKPIHPRTIWTLVHV